MLTLKYLSAEFFSHCKQHTVGKITDRAFTSSNNINSGKCENVTIIASVLSSLERNKIIVSLLAIIIGSLGRSVEDACLIAAVHLSKLVHSVKGVDLCIFIQLQCRFHALLKYEYFGEVSPGFRMPIKRNNTSYSCLFSLKGI